MAEILQNYMTRSEQLDTRLLLAADRHRAAGMLLQKLPDQGGSDDDAWDRAGHLAATLRAEELLELETEQVLHRLFHEEDLRLFDPQDVRFHCSCSQENVTNMLRMLGREEVDSVIEEQGALEVHCEFCNRRYAFDAVDVAHIFASETAAPGSATRH